MRNMSFSLTTEAMRTGKKTVTRRMGWNTLKAGDIVQAVEKCQGLRKGEKLKPIRQILIKAVRSERLDAITDKEVRKEGFPHMSKEEFIEMFCKSHKGCTPSTMITRIEFYHRSQNHRIDDEDEGEDYWKGDVDDIGSDETNL